MTPVILGILTLLAVALLLSWDIAPTYFPVDAHALLGALPLATIAITHLVYQSAPAAVAGAGESDSAVGCICFLGC